jgi:hypothetical protein
MQEWQKRNGHISIMERNIVNRKSESGREKTFLSASITKRSTNIFQCNVNKENKMFLNKV